MIRAAASADAGAVPALVAALALAAGVTACGKSAQSHLRRRPSASPPRAECREAVLEYRNAVDKQPQFADAELRLAERSTRSAIDEAALGVRGGGRRCCPERADIQITGRHLLLLAAAVRGRAAPAPTRRSRWRRPNRRRAGAPGQRADRALRTSTQALERDGARRRPRSQQPRCTATSARCGWPRGERRGKPRPPSARRWRSSRSRSLPHLALGNYLWSDRPGWPKPKPRFKTALTRPTPRTCWRSARPATFYLATDRAARGRALPGHASPAPGGTAGARFELASLLRVGRPCRRCRSRARGSGEDAARLGGRAVRGWPRCSWRPARPTQAAGDASTRS